MRPCSIGSKSAFCRDHFLRFPELLQILDYDNGYASVAWLAHSRVLFESLEALGFSGDGLVAAIRWYWNLVMSAITVEVRETLAPVGVTDIAAAGLDSQVREVVVAIDAAVRRKGFHNQLFEFHLEMAGRALQGGIVGPSNEDQRA